MPTITLKKFLRKQAGLQQILSSLLEQNGGGSILDGDGSVLVGRSISAEQDRHPVVLEAETVGWVSGGEQAAGTAALLAFLLEQESDKKSLAGELIDRYRELNLLYHLSERMAVSPNLDAIATAAMEETIRMMRATSGMILLYQPGTTTLFASVVCGHPYQLAPPGRLIERVMETGRADLANCVAGEDYFLETNGHFVSLMCAPLKTEKGSLGAILLVGEPERVFTAGELKLLNTVALQVAPAIEIARLTRVAIEKARFEQELQMAREVQESLMPVEIPAMPGWSFACRWRPAREVSGDFYDIIPFQEIAVPDERSQGSERDDLVPFADDIIPVKGDMARDGEKLGLVIADVTDKGMPASLFSVFVRSALHASVDPRRTSAETIARTNRLICRDSHQGLFATLFYAQLETGTGALTYVNAGHNPPLLYHSTEDTISLLTRTGLPLGIELEEAYGQNQNRLEPGDFILFYTDGVTETMNADNKEFGLERLREVIYNHKDESTGQILDAVERALDAYKGQSPSFDDVTMMIVRRN